MLVNFYSNNIEYGITIPVRVYKFTAITEPNYKIQENSKVDVLGELILTLLENKEKFNYKKLINTIGMPDKYTKLIDAEIKELKDNKNIVLDNDNNIKKININTSHKEYFYIVYDCLNNKFMEYIIPQKEFEQNYLKRQKKLRGVELYPLHGRNENVGKLKNYEICYNIKTKIDESNEAIFLYKENDQEEHNIYGPPYRINLDRIENIYNPIIAEFIIKVNFDQNKNIYFEAPYTKDNNSIYINSYIANKVKNSDIINMIDKNKFNEMQYCEEQGLLNLDKYKKYDKYKKENDLDAYNQRIKNAKKLFVFYEMLNIDGETYKSCSVPILELDKIVKSILKEITDKFVEVTVDRETDSKKNRTCIRKFTELDEINDIKIISSILDKNTKKIHEGRKMIEFTGQESIVSYLICIYLSKFFNDNNYEKEIFDFFSKDRESIKFLNDVWMYRNNTVHSVEKRDIYDIDYDMDNMYKERLKEVFEELIAGLMNFIKKIKGDK